MFPAITTMIQRGVLAALATCALAFCLSRDEANAADIYYEVRSGESVRIVVNNYGENAVGYDYPNGYVHGTLDVTPDATPDLIYTSAADFVGTDVIKTTAYTGPTSNIPVASDTHYIVVKPKITFSASNWPNTKKGAAYSQSVTATYSGGSAAVTYSVTNGTLPAGLSLDGSSGTISGAPTQSGNWTFTYKALNGDGYSAEQSMTLAVGPDIDDVTATVAANSNSNVIPLGLSGTLMATAVSSATNGAAGVSSLSIVYTPLGGYSGSDSFTYTVTDTATGLTDTALVTVTVTPPTLSMAPESLMLPTTAVAYSQTFYANNGTFPYSFAVSSGTLPAGLSLSSDGVMSGTPSAEGMAFFQITATDAYGATGSRNYALFVSLSPPAVADVAANVSANSTNNPITVALSGGTATSVSVVSGPAHGTTSVSGTAITYTPTAGYSGSDSFSYTASNGAGTSATATVSITVAPATLVISPSILPSGTAAAAYSQTLSAANGTAPYVYAITGGTLPAGLGLSPGGVLSGTPADQGSTSFQVTVTDAYGATGSLPYTLAIAEAVPIAGDVSASVDANSTDNAIGLFLSGGSAESVKVETGPAHGTATATGTAINYTPTAGYSGPDSFTYSASNASGTSVPATVTVTVAQPVLTLLPSGTLSLRQSEAFSETFSASGGTAPYQYGLSGSVPDGLTLGSASGILSGTPTVSGSFPLTLTATDAYGASMSVSVTLAIADALPVAPTLSSTTNSGRTVTIDLTAGASGGPFTGADLLSISPANAGTAVIVLGDTAASNATASFASAFAAGRYKLRFTANPDFSGTVVASYTLTSASGTSAPASVQIQVSARPILSADPDLVGLVEAQAAAASRLADSQIDTISDHLRSLRGSACLKNEVSVSMTDGADGQAPVNVGTQCSPLAGGDLAVWSSGSIAFGDNDGLNGESGHDFATLSLTGGIDYRLSETVIGGLAIGYSRDRTAIGTNSTSSVNQAASASLYGVYQPGGGFFVEGLAGAALLDFTSLRTTPSGGEAEASRSGRQIFGALTGGYDYTSGDLKITSYARLRASHSIIDGAEETGADWENAQFGETESDSLAATLGLVIGYDITLETAIVTPELSLDFSREFLETGASTVTYADDSWPIDYVIPGSSSNRDNVTLGLGLTVARHGGATLSGRYKTSFDAEGLQSQRLSVDLNGRF